jgi:pimeloyl-ACP methyl ester carboxylesterase
MAYNPAPEPATAAGNPTGGKPMPSPNRKSSFVTANGVRLHYLDWGGSGPALIFLPGMGGSAFVFNQFAPRFTGQFHVLALTRRGHGDSDYPETGYDADTLTEDIRQFMDALQIDRASLAGHSLAGVELTHFAATYPQRVYKLIYLDALDDRRAMVALNERSPLKDLNIRPPQHEPHSLEEFITDMRGDFLAYGQPWSEVLVEEISHCVKPNEAGIWAHRMPPAVGQMFEENLVKGYAPKPVTAPIPVLSFVARFTPKPPPGLTEEQIALASQFWRDEAEPMLNALISDFQSRFPQAQIVVIPEGHHVCFVFQEELVYGEMMKFLME